MSTSDDEQTPEWFAGGGSSTSAHDEQPVSAEQESETAHLSAVDQPEDTGDAPPAGSWFDATEARPEAEPVSPSPAPPAGKSVPLGLKLVIGGVVLFVAAVAAAGASLHSLLPDGGDEAGSSDKLTLPAVVTEPETGTASPTASAGPADECASSSSSGVTTGNGPGDTSSVAGTTLAFEHAYYVDRDAKKAATTWAKDSKLASVDALQQGIDSVPKGTTHCVKVIPDGASAATVELTETRPGSSATVMRERVTTTREGDAVRIVSIDDLP